MNQSALQAMQLDANRRCPASGLKQILAATPVIIVTEPETQLREYMGLGKIVYIEPLVGQIRDVKLGQDVEADPSRTSETNYLFNYRGQRFDIKMR